MGTKRILLIFPGHYYSWSAPAPGIGYIASALEGIGVKVKFIDCQITRDYKQKIISLLPEYPVVGLSVNAGNVSSALEIAGAIRAVSPRTRIIMGGPHATSVYDKLIPEYADIVVRGEGEETIAELMRANDLSRVEGIAYWDGGLKVNSPRPYIEDLDKLNFPAWHLYDLGKYRFRNVFNPHALIVTSRGCPYDCIYCVKNIHGNKVRLRSIDNILEEIDCLVYNFGVKEILIMDDLFTLYPDRVKEFCRDLIKSQTKIRFALGGGIRIAFGDQEMFDLLAQAGCYMVDIVIESGSQEILDKIGRQGRITETIETVDMIKKTKMKLSFFCMFGFPFETVETIQKTIDFTRKMNFDTGVFVLATPYPGTKFYEIVKNNGSFLYDPIKESAQIGKNASYETAFLKARDMELMLKKAYKNFYLRPKQIWKIFINRFPNFKRMLESVKLGKNLIYRRRLWS